eukprot:gene6917-7135_t
MQTPGQSKEHKVTLIPGDGIGPEVTNAVVQVVDVLKAPITWERFDGLSGALPDGMPRMDVPKDMLDSIRRNKVCLKGTLFTPLSKKNTSTQSLNVQLRKDLELGVNLVHGFSMPGLELRHHDLDIVVVITEERSLTVAEYAFEFAYLNNRRRVTAVHKANIMKKGDGMFLKACKEVAARYPNIEYTEMIVDNTCMQLVSRPNQFDVMVTPNLYGNLVANIVAALLLSTSMMLRHLQLHSFSDRLESAVIETYMEADKSVLTPDVGGTAARMVSH